MKKGETDIGLYTRTSILHKCHENSVQSMIYSAFLTLEFKLPRCEISFCSNDTFENACVEFDELSLRPTYKILWGVPGFLASYDFSSIKIRASFLN